MPASRRWVDKPGDGRRDPPDAPSSKDQENRVCFVTVALCCHNSKKDAPHDETADAVDPVVPIFRHGAQYPPEAPHPRTAGTMRRFRTTRRVSPVEVCDHGFGGTLVLAWGPGGLRAAIGGWSHGAPWRITGQGHARDREPNCREDRRLVLRDCPAERIAVPPHVPSPQSR